MAIVAWWAVIVSVCVAYWPKARMSTMALVAGGALVALAVLSAVSLDWAGNAGGAYSEAVRAAGYAGVFALAAVAVTGRSGLRWLGGLALGLVIVGAIGLASRLLPGVDLGQDLPAFLPNAKTRLSAPVGYWNGLAAAMALAVVLLCGLSAAAGSRLGRALALAGLPVPVLTIFLASSRGGAGAAVVGIAVLLAVGPRRGRLVLGALAAAVGCALVVFAAAANDDVLNNTGTDGGPTVALLMLLVAAVLGASRYLLDPLSDRRGLPRRARQIVAAGLVAAAVIGLLALDPVRRVDEFATPPEGPGGDQPGFVTRHLAGAEGSGRVQFWESGLDAFASHPVRGLGAGGYEAWWQAEGELDMVIRDAHSLYVEQLAELGLPGLACVLLFFAAAAIGGVRRRLGEGQTTVAGVGLAVLATGAVSAGLDWSWELPIAFGPVVVAAAVLTTWRPDPDPAKPSRLALGLAAALAGWVAIVGSVLALAGTVKLEESREQTRGGDLSGALQSARQAASVEPWAAEPPLQEALVYERQGELDPARAAVARALERAPSDWTLWLVRARLATKSGDVATAERAISRARALNPRSPLFRVR